MPSLVIVRWQTLIEINSLYPKCLYEQKISLILRPSSQHFIAEARNWQKGYA